MKRGQAAVEFLMNYGWVLLVVLIAVAALAYFGILTPGDSLPETCLFFPGISCDSFRVNNESVMMIIVNGGGKKLEEVSFTVLGEGPCQGDTSNIEKIGNGDKKTLTINCTDSPVSGTAFRRDIRIDYREVEGLPHSKVGRLDTKVE